MSRFFIVIALVMTSFSTVVHAQNVLPDPGGNLTEVLFLVAARSAEPFLPRSVDRLAYLRVVEQTEIHIFDMPVDQWGHLPTHGALTEVSRPRARVSLNQTRLEQLSRLGANGQLFRDFGIPLSAAQVAQVNRMGGLTEEDALAAFAAHAYLQLLGYRGGELNQIIVRFLSARASAHIGGVSSGSESGTVGRAG